MDHICDSLNFVGAGIDDRLHDGWRHSCPAGHCHHCNIDPGYSRTKTSITVSILNGSDESFQKEVVNRPERFYRIYELSAKMESDLLLRYEWLIKKAEDRDTAQVVECHPHSKPLTSGVV